MGKIINVILLLVAFSIAGCTRNESVIEEGIETKSSIIEEADTKEEFEGGYIEQSHFEDFFIIFDSVMNYSAQYFVGSDNEYEYLKSVIANVPLSAHYLSLVSGELHGEGIVELDTTKDSSIIGKAGEFAPYIDLNLDKGAYTVYFQNQIIMFLVNTSIDDAIHGNAGIYKKLVYYSDDASVKNSIKEDTSKLTIEQLRAIVKDHFSSGIYYVIGTKEPVEYLGSILGGVNGYSVDSWLQNPDVSKKSNAIFIDDSTFAFGINNSNNKLEIVNFIPEVYDIRQNGIYVIDNDGTIFIYIKSNSYDFKNYIDYIYKDVNFDTTISKFSSSADNSEEYLKQLTIVDPVYEIYPVENFYHDAINNGASFNGYFYNIDHSNPTDFLKNGPQTQNINHKDVLEKFNDNKDLSTLIEIYRYISETEYKNSSDISIDKFARTVEEIIESKTLTGCTDYGLLFASLARDKGIPTIFIQTAHESWIYDRVREIDKGIFGHILIEVYIDGKWRYIDSTSGKYFPEYNTDNFSLNDGYYVFSKSIEVYDSGISTENENFQNMRNLFMHFNLEAYVDPKYDYIDLRTGNVHRNNE